MNSTQFNRRRLIEIGTASLGALALSRTAGAQAKAKAPAKTAAKPDAKTDAMMTATPAAPEKPKVMASASDISVLSSALGVEQLQAAYYAQVLGAHRTRAYLGERALSALTLMSAHEAAHVQTISDALSMLGAEVPAAPTFRFPYNAFVSPVGMAWLGYTLEEIAIGSHLDALERLESRPLRQTVATIMGADSAQAALLRSLSGFEFSPRYFEAKLAPAQVNSLLAMYRS